MRGQLQLTKGCEGAGMGKMTLEHPLGGGCWLCVGQGAEKDARGWGGLQLGCKRLRWRIPYPKVSVSCCDTVRSWWGHKGGMTQDTALAWQITGAGLQRSHLQSTVCKECPRQGKDAL